MTGTGTSQVCWTGVSFHESGKTVTFKFNTSCTTFKGILINDHRGFGITDLLYFPDL